MLRIIIKCAFCELKSCLSDPKPWFSSVCHRRDPANILDFFHRMSERESVIMSIGLF